MPENNSARDLLENAVPRLLDWYGDAKKPFPWRQNPTAYHVWISEIMLQQTRTAAVIPYFERFVSVLPNVKALSEVEDDVLMKLWEGLGYYSRARNLKKAAKIVMSDFGGQLPRTAKELLTLPGIGPYTAGAIASIAFGEPNAAVDGNVLRVVMRLFACRDDIMLASTKKWVTDALESVYPVGTEAGKFTEALMELGEAVCIPNGEPRCLDCPLSEICLALKNGEQNELPVRTPKKPRKIEHRTVLLLKCGNKYALAKRPEGGLLSGLWEFPNTVGKLDSAGALAAAQALGAKATECTPLGDAIHIFTHIEWHMTGYLVECESLPCDMAHASAEETLERYAIPKAFRAYTQTLV
jgi:A/G-specific adenine glycosylase